MVGYKMADTLGFLFCPFLFFMLSYNFYFYLRIWLKLITHVRINNLVEYTKGSNSIWFILEMLLFLCQNKTFSDKESAGKVILVLDTKMSFMIELHSTNMTLAIISFLMFWPLILLAEGLKPRITHTHTLAPYYQNISH